MPSNFNCGIFSAPSFACKAFQAPRVSSVVFAGRPYAFASGKQFSTSNTVPSVFRPVNISFAAGRTSTRCVTHYDVAVTVNPTNSPPLQNWMHGDTVTRIMLKNVENELNSLCVYWTHNAECCPDRAAVLNKLKSMLADKPAQLGFESTMLSKSAARSSAVKGFLRETTFWSHKKSSHPLKDLSLVIEILSLLDTSELSRQDKLDLLSITNEVCSAFEHACGHSRKKFDADILMSISTAYSQASPDIKTLMVHRRGHMQEKLTAGLLDGTGRTATLPGRPLSCGESVRVYAQRQELKNHNKLNRVGISLKRLLEKVSPHLEELSEEELLLLAQLIESAPAVEPSLTFPIMAAIAVEIKSRDSESVTREQVEHVLTACLQGAIKHPTHDDKAFELVLVECLGWLSQPAYPEALYLKSLSYYCLNNISCF